MRLLQFVRQRTTLVVSLLLLVCSAVAYGARALRKGEAASSVKRVGTPSAATAATGAEPAAETATAPLVAPSPPHYESAIINIRPQGFETSAIMLTKGSVHLAVHNRSGLRSVHLIFAAETGARLQEVLVPMEKLDWHGFVELRPGRYFLTEADHPLWRCQITVSPQ